MHNNFLTALLKGNVLYFILKSTQVSIVPALITGGLGLASSYLSGKSNEKMNEQQLEQERANIQMNNRIRASQQKRSQDFLNSSMNRFDQNTSGTPQSITRLQELIRNRSLPEQQRAMAQGRIARQQQGIRGVDAAVLEQQQANALQQQLAENAEELALRQQLEDRANRAKLAAQQSGIALPGALLGTDDQNLNASKMLSKALDLARKTIKDKFYEKEA